VIVVDTHEPRNDVILTPQAPPGLARPNLFCDLEHDSEANSLADGPKPDPTDLRDRRLNWFRFSHAQTRSLIAPDSAAIRKRVDPNDRNENFQLAKNAHLVIQFIDCDLIVVFRTGFVNLGLRLIQLRLAQLDNRSEP
jgi:hypothetical protein